jgi:DNA-binding FadR family transcriptional regulator
LETSRKKARLTNVRFHSEVAKITQNALIVFLSESITQIYSAMLIEMTHTKLDKKGIAKLIAEHRTIMDAIADHDPGAAFERTKRHLIKTYRMYSRIIPDSCDEHVDKRIKYFAGL